MSRRRKSYEDRLHEAACALMHQSCQSYEACRQFAAQTLPRDPGLGSGAPSMDHRPELMPNPLRALVAKYDDHVNAEREAEKARNAIEKQAATEAAARAAEMEREQRAINLNAYRQYAAETNPFLKARLRAAHDIDAGRTLADAIDTDPTPPEAA